MDEVSQGYGSPEDMMASGDSELASQEAPPEQGGDMEAMIAEGVQAYMETQDPQVAVQVVMMLAEAMGLSGEAPAPGQGGAPAPAGPPPAGPAPTPMAKNGGKFGWFGKEDTASEFQKFVTNK